MGPQPTIIGICQSTGCGADFYAGGESFFFFGRGYDGISDAKKWGLVRCQEQEIDEKWFVDNVNPGLINHG